jgi:hypothetical protein
VAADLYIQAAEGDLEALLYLSDHRINSGDSVAAEKLLHQAASRGLTDAWIDLARIREGTGDNEAAESFLARAHADHFALRQRARLRLLAGDADACMRLLEEAVELGSADAMRQLAQLLEDTSGDSARIADLRKRGVEPDTTKELKRAARAAMRYDRKLAKHADEIVRIGSEDEHRLQEAREVLDEEDPAFNLMLGRIERNLGHLAEAKMRLTRAINGGSLKENGTNPPLTYLAELIRDSGDTDGSERLQKYGLDIDGSISEPWTVSIERCLVRIAPASG